MAVEKTPEKKGKSKDKEEKEKLAGKFEDAKALETAYLESEKKISELGERLSRAEELVNAYVASQKTSPAAKPADKEDFLSDDNKKLSEKLFDDPAGVLKQIRENIRKDILAEVNKTRQQETQQTAVKDMFYQANPDLKQHEAIVASQANMLMTERPNLPLQTAMKEVADRTRAYIAKIREDTKLSGDDKTIHVGSGETKPDEGKSAEEDETPKIPTQEEALGDFMAEKKAVKQKALGISDLADEGEKE